MEGRTAARDVAIFRAPDEGWAHGCACAEGSPSLRRPDRAWRGTSAPKLASFAGLAGVFHPKTEISPAEAPSMVVHGSRMFVELIFKYRSLNDTYASTGTAKKTWHVPGAHH